MTQQWIDRIDLPMTPGEIKVLAAIKSGANNYRQVALATGIKLGTCNNIMTKLKNRGLIKKVWVAVRD